MLVRLITFSVLIALASTAYAAPLPQPFKVEYTLNHGPLTIARMVREFTLMPTGAYRYTSETTTTGLAALVQPEQIRESSEGTVNGDVLSPQRYQYHRSGKKERRVAIIFNRSSGTIEGSAKGRSWQMELQPGIFDKLLYQLAMMRDLQDEKRDLQYLVADSGATKTYRFSFGGEETIKTPAGIYRAFRFQRQKSGSKRKTTLWCAPELGYLPVQVDYQNKHGTVTTARLSSVTRSPALFSD